MIRPLSDSDAPPQPCVTARPRSRFLPLLYLICALTDFAAFVVVFAVSRGVAQGNAGTIYLGVVGAGLSLSAGVGSILGGWLAHRLSARGVFLTGAAIIGLSIVTCAAADPASAWFLPGYWALGIGLGFLYPPLVGWLNQGEDVHADRRGVSRRLILFCVAWNVGMMGGQLTGGALFARGPGWVYAVALLAAAVNMVVAVAAVRRLPVAAPAPGGAAGPERGAPPVAVAFKRLSWFANLGGMFGGSMVIHLLPDLAVVLGIPPAEHGKLLACWRAVAVGTYLLMHHVAFWHYRLATAVASQALGALGLMVIARAESGGALFLGLALLGQLVGYNYFSGLFYSTAGSSHERRALAAGIHEGTLAVGMAVGTLTGGVLASAAGHRTPYLLAAAVIGVLIVAQSAAWLRWVRPLRRRSLP